MKNLATLLLLNLIYTATTSNATPTLTPPDLAVRNPAPDPSPTGLPNVNWFTVTEYNSPSEMCEGPHTAQQSSPFADTNPRSGCKDVASGTTRLLWESSSLTGYLLTFDQPGCVGPIISTKKTIRECFEKGTVMSYEAWH